MPDALDRVLEEILSTTSNPKLPNLFQNVNGKRKSSSGVDGKYFKGQDNTSKSMISQRDKRSNSKKGQLKKSLEMPNQRKVLSRDEFNKMFNDSGERELNLSDGNWKSLNSKTGRIKARQLKDGRIQVRNLN